MKYQGAVWKVCWKVIRDINPKQYSYQYYLDFGTYKDLPRWIEVLVSLDNELGRGGSPKIRNAFKYRWVIRNDS